MVAAKLRKKENALNYFLCILFVVNLPVHLLLLLYFVLNFILFIIKFWVLGSKSCLPQLKHLYILEEAEDL